MVHDRSVWQGFVRGNVWGITQGVEGEPLTLTRCHNYMKPLKSGSPSVGKART